MTKPILTFARNLDMGDFSGYFQAFLITPGFRFLYNQFL